MKNSLLSSILVIGLLSVALGQAQGTETTSLAELDTPQQALVSAGLGAEDDRYHARPEGGSFLLASPAQSLTASLSATEVAVKEPAGTVGMHLLGWGCEGGKVPATGGHAGAKANRVELAWEKGLTEWYVSGPLGLEQGFTVEAPAAGCEAAGELMIELAVAGSAVLGGDGRSLAFPEAGLRYRGLVAVDATGRELPAVLELAGQRLEIRTEVAAAQWPVTVDPIFENSKLLASDGAASDEFGTSVAVSGSTVVIGARLDDDNGGNSGSAYMFIKPGGSWTGTLIEPAKMLLPSHGAQGDLFGISVAVSGDSAVIGAPKDNDNGLNSGSAYVYPRLAFIFRWIRVGRHVSLVQHRSLAAQDVRL